MQKLLTNANRLPFGASLKAFQSASPILNQSLTKSKRELKTYIKDLTSLQIDLFSLSK
jgi:hypothetical protein